MNPLSRTARTLSRRARIGIAVSARGITVTARRADTEHIVTRSFEGDDVVVGMRGAIRALRADLDAAFGVELAGARVDVAMLPPLAEARLVPLPPLRAAEAEAVIRRDASRYFLAVPAPRLVAVDPARREPGTPAFAIAASADLVEAIRASILGAGWSCGTITAAHAAWLQAAGAGADRVVAEHDGAAHIVRLDHGAVVELRRLPAADTAAITEAVGAAAAVRRVGRDTVANTAGPARGSAADPGAVVAARHAGGAGLDIVPATAHAERRSAEQRTAVRLAVAAVVLLVMTAAVEWWGAARELDQLRGRRAEIRAQVGPLLEARDSLDAMSLRTVDVETLAGETPRWTAALFDLAMLLPHESHVTRLYATGDTLIIEGEGVRAGAALQALRSAQSLRDAQLMGTVDRELADGSTTVERFRMRARLAPQTAVQP